MSRYAKYAWAMLVYNLAVILWGVVVRATGSGAGCGSHWPLCNGQVVPIAPQVATMVEYAHRLTSGLSIPLLLILLVWGFRSYPKGHPVRLGSSLSVLFIFSEAFVGAGLVLFGWVAKDQSIGRVISIPIHLVNTFLLLASITLTAWWASGGDQIRLRNQGIVLWGLGLGLLGVLTLGATGAITALGDSLFPAGSLGQGISQDFSSTAPFLLRLRVYHPLIAITVGLYSLFLAGLLAMFYPETQIRRPALALCGLIVAQLLAGLVNLLLLAPVPMQLIHLFLADLLWIAMIILSAGVLGRNTAAHSLVSSQVIHETAGKAGSQSQVRP